MHFDDTPIKFLTEVIVLGKLLKEIVWSKSVRGFGRSFFKKIISVPRGINIFKKPSHLVILTPGSGKTQHLLRAATINYQRNLTFKKNSSFNFY